METQYDITGISSLEFLELAALLCVHEEQFFVLSDNFREHGNPPLEMKVKRRRPTYRNNKVHNLNACEIAGSRLKATTKKSHRTEHQIYNCANLAGEKLQNRLFQVCKI